MARTVNVNEEIIVVSKGEEDTGKLAMLGCNGKFHRSVIPEMPCNLPAGAVQYFAMPSAPKGWLKADGSAVFRTDYADLFSAVGVLFGEGDGNTTFNLPDLRGEFIRGFDDGRGVDVNREIGSAQTDTLKEHTHYFFETDIDPTTVGDSTAADIPCCMDTGAMSTATSERRFVSNTGGAETCPRNLALLACIKY